MGSRWVCLRFGSTRFPSSSLSGSFDGRWLILDVGGPNCFVVVVVFSLPLWGFDVPDE